jgi:hypothetical protein
MAAGPDGERGQATVEQAALVLLVAAALGAATLAADGLGARSGIGDAVRRQLARAICLVGGAGPACEADRRPCVVAADRVVAEASLGLSILRLREGGALAVERRSDGTVAVTVLNRAGGGLDLAGDRRLRLLAGRGLGGDGSLTAALAGVVGHGATWILPGAAAARRLVDAIRTNDRLPELLRPIPDLRLLPPGIPPPSTTTHHRELSASLRAALRAGLARGSLDLGAEDVASWGQDRATGRRTVVLRGRAAAALAGRLGGATRAAGAAAEGEIAVTFDAAGRPLELVRVEVADVAGSRDLPAVVQPAAGLLASRGGRRSAVVETHLDLTSAGNLAAASAVVRAARDGGHGRDAIRATSALRERLDRLGVVGARVYADDERRHGLSVPRGVLPFDAGLAKTTTHSRLVAAVARGPDGTWTRRPDCLRAA